MRLRRRPEPIAPPVPDRTPAERDALVAEVRRQRDALVGIASGGCAECTSAPGWSGCPEDDACDACTARYALEASNG